MTADSNAPPMFFVSPHLPSIFHHLAFMLIASSLATCASARSQVYTHLNIERCTNYVVTEPALKKSPDAATLVPCPFSSE